jgi:hypothetical protein
MIILTLRISDRRVEVQDLATGRIYCRTLAAGMIFRLLRDLQESGRYARIHNSDQTQTYQFAPVMIYHPKKRG